MTLQFEKQYREKGFASQRRYPNEALVRFMSANYLNLSAKKRKKVKILELGCGSGANLWMLAKEDFNVYGIDIAPTGVKLCRQMLKDWKVSAKVKLGNMRKLDFPDNFFDAIVDIVSVQHVDLAGHKKVYGEVFRCLKTGGRFFQWHLGTKSVSFTKGGGKRIDKLTIESIVNPKVPFCGCGLTCFLTPPAARRMLSSAGFKDINIETFIRTYKNRKQIIEYLAIQCKK
jgi:ubiquinone/menaquinone biosynthesis C-methylase UbiE